MNDNILRVINISKAFFIKDKKQDGDNTWRALLECLLHKKRKKIFNKFYALRNISFDLKKGRSLGIVGLNGSGKSTLLQIIAGTMQPTAGSIESRQRVAALLELGSGFNPDYTGRENIYINAAVFGLTKDDTKLIIADIIKFSELETFIDQPVRFYSSGMLVRLAFSIAISVKPQILIIDEALSVGDELFSHKSFMKVKEMIENGTTIIFCSHSLYQVECLCTHAMWIHKGKMRKYGDTKDTITEYKSFLKRNQIDNVNVIDQEYKSLNLDKPNYGKILNYDIYRNDEIITKDFIYRSLIDDISVDITFNHQKDIPVPSVAVSFTDELNTIISGLGTANDGIVCRTKDQNGYYKLTIDRIPLLKGIYFINIVLFCSDGIHVLDYVNKAFRIVVKQNNLEQGFVHLPHSWKDHND